MRADKLKYGTQSVVLIIIVIAILGVVNFIATRFFLRADLTENNEYTISEASKNVVRSLDDLITVKAYFTENLPPYLINVRRQVADLLEEYSAYSDGNLQFEFVDPAADSTEEMKIQRMGIPPVQMNVIEKDKRQVVKGYLGIAILYEDKNESIPVVQDTRTLEYDLTTAIKRISSKDVKKIGFLTGHGELSLATDLEVATRELQKQYSVLPVDISSGKKVSEDIATLIIAGPDSSFSDRDKYEIDQFLMRGGKLVVLLEGVQRDERLLANPLFTNLDDMLLNYGIRINHDLVLDRFNAPASFSQGFFSFTLPYPFWPKAIKADFAQDHPVVNRLEALIFPWSSSVEAVQTTVDRDSLEFTELVKTSDQSWTQQGRFDLNPQQRFQPTSMRQRNLASIVTGKFKSFFSDKEIPKVDGAEANGPDDSNRQTLAESPATRILVVGDADFITSNFIQQSRDNLSFFLNAIDWLTLDESLIGIRSRGITDRPLEEVSEAKKAIIRFFAVLAVPFVVVAYGLGRFYWRRKEKKLYEQMQHQSS